MAGLQRIANLSRLRGSSLQLSLCRSAHDATGENDNINPDFVNRNPRNLEMLRVTRKPQGWALEVSKPHYWYKLNLEQSNRHISGWVEHYTQTVVASASTREWAIKQQLYSNTSVSTAENIGRILARRCLESGIAEVYTELEKYKDSSEKVRVFLAAIEEGGIRLEEPFVINERLMRRAYPTTPTLPWHVHEEEVLEDKPTK